MNTLKFVPAVWHTGVDLPIKIRKHPFHWRNNPSKKLSRKEAVKYAAQQGWVLLSSLTKGKRRQWLKAYRNVVAEKKLMLREKYFADRV